ncbi:hypothetical protein CC80DRAFT_236815 [Byssothecium circinans]|uniref:Uncharacterized protein n=1 Tax=Byssothecium circinans TaxID=147558 RepID=A0A6A5UBS1_9PLEO|nr:hypothetical protein CC80DRAFT_236815 [Byssothecium circinans]
MGVEERYFEGLALREDLSVRLDCRWSSGETERCRYFSLSLDCCGYSFPCLDCFGVNKTSSCVIGRMVGAAENYLAYLMEKLGAVFYSGDRLTAQMNDLSVLMRACNIAAYGRVIGIVTAEVTDNVTGSVIVRVIESVIARMIDSVKGTADGCRVSLMNGLCAGLSVLAAM